MDADFVAANAGEYRSVGDSSTARFTSDGNGNVRYIDPASATDMWWSGTREHHKYRTRFRPLPSPLPVAEQGKQTRAKFCPHCNYGVGDDGFCPCNRKPEPAPVVDDDLQARYDTLYAQHTKALAKLSAVQAELQLSQGRVESLTAEAQRLSARLLTADRENMELAGRVEAARELCDSAVEWKCHKSVPAHRLYAAIDAWLAKGGK